MARLVFLTLAAIGAAQADRDAAVASLRTDAHRLRAAQIDRALRRRGCSRAKLAAATLLDVIADRMEARHG